MSAPTPSGSTGAAEYVKTMVDAAARDAARTDCEAAASSWRRVVELVEDFYCRPSNEPYADALKVLLDGLYHEVYEA